MTSSAPSTNDTPGPHKGLGTCWLLYGILRLAIAILLVLFAREATVMFGALLVEVADSTLFMAAFHAFYLFAIILSVLCGVLGLLAGLALLSGQRSSRTLAVIAAFFSLSELPIGITLGVYTLWTLPRSTSRRSTT
jgi:hypothetical protein